MEALTAITPEHETQIRADARAFALESAIRLEEYRKAMGIADESWPQWRIAVVMFGAVFLGALVAGLLSFSMLRGCHL